MKTLLIVVSLLSFSAFAQTTQGQGKSMDEKKAMMIQNLDERINQLNEVKSCVTSATDQAGLKACHQKMKQWREAHKAEWQSKRAQRKANRKK